MDTHPTSTRCIAFVDDYDDEMARQIADCLDMWPNKPVPYPDAGGTSGMKTSVNSVSNLSVLDGYWIQRCSDGNGWAFREETGDEINGDRTARDTTGICRLLEN